MRLALIWRKTKLPSSSSSSSSHPYSCSLNPLWSKTKGIQAPENAECLAEEVGLQFSLLRSQHAEKRRLKSFLTQRGTQSGENATALFDNDFGPCYRKSEVIKQNKIHFTENGFIFLSGFLGNSSSWGHRLFIAERCSYKSARCLNETMFLDLWGWRSRGFQSVIIQWMKTENKRLCSTCLIQVKPKAKCIIFVRTVA